MKQGLTLEPIFSNNRKTFFRILELPFSALVEYLKEVPIGLSLDAELLNENETRLERISSDEKSLSEEIVENLVFARLDEETERIAEYIAYNIDDHGNMMVSIEEVCEKLKTDASVVNRAINAIKEVGPDGILEGKVVGFGVKSHYIEPDVIVNEDLSISVKEIGVRQPRHFTKLELKIFIFLNEAINYRRQLLLTLGQMLVRENTLFLSKKIEYPQKITMSQAAKSSNVSVSTVSRAISGKYVKTPIGIFQMRSFFGRNVEKDYLLKELSKIVAEDCKLTDKEIAERLRPKGIYISRRTVNKYRQIFYKLSKGND
ncbi:hypothetical protein ACSFC1_06110 [Pseudothermotoga sp. U03pept]|uniref:RNA polymerase factor sigma-54 n=1 Tax=Pseudothermotoga sp. U03pept TaxID=3447012 RepID=UPI0030A6743B